MKYETQQLKAAGYTSKKWDYAWRIISLDGKAITGRHDTAAQAWLAAWGKIGNCTGNNLKYSSNGNVNPNGPRCKFCGDLLAWGTHPMCR